MCFEEATGKEEYVLSTSTPPEQTDNCILESEREISKRIPPEKALVTQVYDVSEEQYMTILRRTLRRQLGY